MHSMGDNKEREFSFEAGHQYAIHYIVTSDEPVSKGWPT
jgi:hypothetical protein